MKPAFLQSTIAPRASAGRRVLRLTQAPQVGLLLSLSLMSALAFASGLGVTPAVPEPAASAAPISNAVPTAPAVPAAEPDSPALSYILLRYEALVAGASAGSASVALARRPGLEPEFSYRLAGEAKAEGLLDALSPWKSQFWVSGRRTANAVEDVHYRYREQGRNKERDVTVAAQRLRVIKNGKVRPERQALPGFDILSALFVVARCSSSLTLHTGRHGYQLERILPLNPTATDPMAARCEYDVTDDDGERFTVRLRFERVAGQRIPSKIEVEGALTGTLRLIRSRQLTGSCQATPMLAYLCDSA